MVTDRKRPITNWGVLLFDVVWTALAVLFVIVGLSLREGAAWPISSTIVLVLFTAVSGTYVVIGARSIWRESLTFRYRRMLRRSPVATQAKIIERKIEADERQGSADYKLLIEFDSMRVAGATKTLTLSAEVSKTVYEQCLATNIVRINYCREDPQVVLIKDEPFFEHEGVTFGFGRFPGQ